MFFEARLLACCLSSDRFWVIDIPAYFRFSCNGTSASCSTFTIKTVVFVVLDLQP